jgi:signal peptide peptidase SppA
MKLYEINEQGLETLMDMEQFPKSEMDITSFFKQREAYTVQDGVAYIHVFGPLIRNASEFQKRQSLTDYADIVNELERAASDPSVFYVVIRFDSPGGESIGSQEVTNIVESFPKPIVGVVSGVCASAAYKIASGCTVLYSTVSSEIGSIGSIIIIENSKKAMNSLGVSKEIISNDGATFKSVGADYGSLTDEHKQYLQGKVNDCALRFQETVLANRPEVNPETFTAATYKASDAVLMGLIDAVI